MLPVIGEGVAGLLVLELGVELWLGLVAAVDAGVAARPSVLGRGSFVPHASAAATKATAQAGFSVETRGALRCMT